MADTYQILVVDDDFSIVNIIETALKQAGYQVLTAHDGEAACQIVNTKHPHLIIMDVMMPQCNGIIATMKIRQNNNVPILMLSAKAEGSDRVLGLEAGADDYLVKPFYQQELLARVKALLRRYDALGSIRETKSEDQIQVGNIILNTLNRFLASLSAEHRKIFMRRYLYISSVKEIADDYGITESKVKMSLLRSRNQLKAVLEKEGIAL